VHAGLVAASYLQAKDEANYGIWKQTESKDCSRAGIPRGVHYPSFVRERELGIAKQPVYSVVCRAHVIFFCCGTFTRKSMSFYSSPPNP